jgi:hypothetical protein
LPERVVTTNNRLGERPMSKNDTISCPSCGEPGTGNTGGADAPTHCEWCGAEYPVPGEDEPSEPSRQQATMSRIAPDP